MSDTSIASPIFVWLTAHLAMQFEYVPAGAFVMGARGHHADEEPRIQARITASFFLGTYPVTQEQFEVWTTEAGVTHRNGFPNRPTHPAESMDWHQALAFCEWMNETRRSTVPAGYRAGLPTSAQWEYACRAGTDTEYHTGDGIDSLVRAAWFDEDGQTGSTHGVGMKAPNAFGLHDMHGNVDEWCKDGYDEDAYKKWIDGIEDPEVSDSDPVVDSSHRVVRGGSWVIQPRICRSAYRYAWPKTFFDSKQGFRVCLAAAGPRRSAPLHSAGCK